MGADHVDDLGVYCVHESVKGLIESYACAQEAVMGSSGLSVHRVRARLRISPFYGLS